MNKEFLEDSTEFWEASLWQGWLKNDNEKSSFWAFNCDFMHVTRTYKATTWLEHFHNTWFIKLGVSTFFWGTSYLFAVWIY